MWTGEPRRVEVGYWLSSEEHGPRALTRFAVSAEAHGFRHAMISDHLHPWVPQQGHAPFVWTVLGAIAASTDGLHLATGVTTPRFRVHPVAVAQAAATAAVLLEGRFALGLGAGERLNEQAVGDPFPRPGTRRRQLREAARIIRSLLAGETVHHDGDTFTVDHARLYSRPEAPPPVWIAASGRRSAELAAEEADGMVGLAPDPKLPIAFRRKAVDPDGAVVAGQLHVCWADDRDAALDTARRWWPNGALASVSAELARPEQFEALASLVSTPAIGDAVVCGPDPEPIVRALARFGAAGFTRVYVHQVGPDQDGFLEFWTRTVRPLL